ncbi:DUF2059 domain-containing protein [Parvularcula maris]|uniref:DUF2059 domain-containing protein n=1 Tax=Parvularcula maris TaxID=2965077 RepID=A0A9X2RI60_9PROT|nr:DUF2059 domain-containing protein [Parvularcula maris]MCQ8185700.1 DUF2059 domain-containing protein [Parvularcula maris]
MLHRLAQLAPAAALVFSAALAQPGAVPDPAKLGERREAATVYVNGPAMKEMFDQMMSEEAIAAQLSMVAPGAFQQGQLDAMTGVLREEFNAILPEMRAIMIETAAETFTLAELEAANAFYLTPAGRGMMAKTKDFQVKTFPALAPVMQKLQQRIVARAEELMAQE